MGSGLRRAEDGRRPTLRRRGAVLASSLRAAALGHPWRFLTGWLVAWTAVELLLSRTHMYSWHYVVTGAAVLRSPGWFLLYGRHPELQMGPVTFLAAEPVALLPTEAGRIVAAAAMAGLGLLVVRELRGLAPPVSRREGARWLLLSAVVLVGWLEVAVRFGHLDDVLALLLGVMAMRRAREGRLLLAAVLVGLAVDCKPWAVPFAAVLLIPRPSRRLVAPVVVLAVVVLAAWVPFVALDPGSTGVTRFAIRVDPASTLHLLRLAGSGTPAWCRPAQLALGGLLALVAVRLRRWPATLILVVAVRLLLDPATQPYYDSGLLVGAAALDLVSARASPAWRTGLAVGVAVALVYLPSYLLTDLPAVRAVLRTAGLLALVALAALLAPRVDRPSSRPGGVAPA